LLWFLHLDITRNLRYDRATLKIMRQILKPDSNCLDVGAHKGEILEQIIRFAPKGKHIAIEPIPDMARQLETKFKDVCQVYQCAVSNYNGSTTFNHIKNAPAYSGLQQREYAISSPDIEQIAVQVHSLDHLWPISRRLDFIKLDIEGGELHALEGAKNLIEKYKPVIIFEFGLGSAEYYQSTPISMFRFFKTFHMCISELDQWKRGSKGLDEAQFVKHFQERTAYYFAAYPCP
jgi:FkbM family methyltransferase